MKTQRVTLEITYDENEMSPPRLWRWRKLTNAETRVVGWQDAATPRVCPECGGRLAPDETGDAACGACGLAWGDAG